MRVGLIILSGLLCTAPMLRGQVILTEVMFDPVGSESQNEFVEVFNRGSSPVDLLGWQVGDETALDGIVSPDGNPLIIQPGQYGIILDPDYFGNSTIYDSLIPPQALILSIDGPTIGSGGFSNSTAETVLLVDAGGDTVQRYQYSLGNSMGFSDEKIDLLGENLPENWGDSRILNGTPGQRNSIALGEIDLSLGNFRIPAAPLVAGDNPQFHLTAANAGRDVIDGFQWLTFYDLNHNHLADSNEIIDRFENSDALLPGDSLELQGQFFNIPFGELAFGIQAEVAGENNPADNVAILQAFVDDPLRVRLVINEILFEPRSGLEEWVELFNAGAEAVNLKGVLFADARDTIAISTTDDFIAPGDFIVVGGDSDIAFQYSVSENQLRVARGFPTLNNDFDRLRVLGPTGLTYDAVDYTKEWYHRPTTPGTSLEKLNPGFDGQVSANWAASVAPSGGTPGKRNSVFVDVLPGEEELQIFPNPFSPDSDGLEDAAVIQYRLSLETAFITVRIFDLRGRRIRLLANGQAAAGEGQLVWDGRDDDGRIARIGAYICLFQILNQERRVSKEIKKTIILVKR